MREKRGKEREIEAWERAGDTLIEDNLNPPKNEYRKFGPK